MRGHGHRGDQLVDDLGDAGRERRIGGGPGDLLLRLAARAAVRRHPLQQAARPGERQHHADIGPHRPLAPRRRPHLIQDRLTGRGVQDRMPGRPQDRWADPAQHASAGQPVDHAIPAAADVTAQAADDLLGLPAFQVVAHGVVDVGQQLVARPGISGPYPPVVPDRQLPVDGQLGQERAGQADLDEGVAPGTGTCPLSSTATSSSISAISTTGTLMPAAAAPKAQRHQTPGPYCPGHVLPSASADSTPRHQAGRGQPPSALPAPGWRWTFRRTALLHARVSVRTRRRSG